jgi:hypothetical protein
MKIQAEMLGLVEQADQAEAALGVTALVAQLLLAKDLPEEAATPLVDLAPLMVVVAPEVEAAVEPLEGMPQLV